MNDDHLKDNEISRRKFFVAMGSGALMIASAGGLVFTGEFLNPNVLFEPPSKYIVGRPEQYRKNSVVYLPEPKVLIFRETEGYFYAMSAVCTHLGCIVNWKPAEKQIACPCHGSRFNKSGEVVGGPAPEPLRHLSMEYTGDGYLIVDSNTIVDSEVILKI